MSDEQDWIIYGANGYTGTLIARQARARSLRPILAGRNREAIFRLAAELDCVPRVFDLGDVSKATESLQGVQAVLNCAGPFSRTAPAMIAACLQAGAHYLDITGEIDVIELAAQYQDQALHRGVTLLPAVGFDVVPSDCLSAMLKDRLPSAQLLQLAIAGNGRTSRGTAKTALEVLPTGGRARIDGRIQRVPTAWKVMQVPFADQPRWAVTGPWGDVASAYYSTGIPNIEVYFVAPQKQIERLKRFRFLLPVLKWPIVNGLLRSRIGRRLPGPSTEELKTGRAVIWGRAADPQGNEVSATLQTPDGYRLTAMTAVECVERVLGGQTRAGFFTPSRAFGKDFILEFPEIVLHWHESAARG